MCDASSKLDKDLRSSSPSDESKTKLTRARKIRQPTDIIVYLYHQFLQLFNVFTLVRVARVRPRPTLSPSYIIPPFALLLHHFLLSYFSNFLHFTLLAYQTHTYTLSLPLYISSSHPPSFVGVIAEIGAFRTF